MKTWYREKNIFVNSFNTFASNNDKQYKIFMFLTQKVVLILTFH